MGFKRDTVFERVIIDLKKRSTIGIIFYMIVVLIILFTDSYYGRHPEFSRRFLFFVMAICVFRFFHLPFARQTQQKIGKINNRIFLLSVALTGLIWGIGFAAFMIQAGEVNAKLLMVICTAGLSAGGVVAFIPDLRLSIAFSFFMLAPAMVSMIAHHTNMPLVFALFLFFIYLCFMATRGNREYWDALENEYLLEEKSKDLEKMSRVDGLTGLYNRRYFDEAFLLEWNRCIRHQTPLSIIICDIDHFKRINDQYGHLAGDEYLKAIASLLKTVFRRTTDITARYGGEEFVILMVEESCENAIQLSETMRELTQAFCMEYEGQAILATISMGIATCIPRQSEKKEVLISKADKALYQSKANGRNQVTNSDD